MGPGVLDAPAVRVLPSGHILPNHSTIKTARTKRDSCILLLSRSE